MNYNKMKKTELIKECTRLKNLYNEEIEKSIKLQNEVDSQDLIICEYLKCGLYDLNNLQKWNKILDNHYLDFGDVFDYLDGFGDLKMDYNLFMMGIFEILLNEFQKEFNLEIEEGKDYNFDLNYYCSDIYFTNEELQDKFDKWL